MDPLTILAAFGPLAVELGKSLIGRFIAPDTFKPATVDDWLKMRAADVEMFKAMQDNGDGTGYPWVSAIIRLQRPAVAVIALSTWAYQSIYVPGGATETVSNFAACIGFYLFGDRTLFYARKAQTK